MADAPIDHKYHETMISLAGAIDSVLNANGKRRVAFALLVTEFGMIEDGRVNYISNANRADMIAMMREWLAQAEGAVLAEGADTLQ